MVYRYTTSLKSPNAVESVELSNTATLLAETTKITSVTDKTTVNVTTASFTATVEGIQIYKVDKDNNGLYLPGAEFSLYAWDSSNSSSDPWTLVSDSLFTNKSGGLVGGQVDVDEKTLAEIINANGFNLRNQAFKLVETKAPAGYIQPAPDNAYYFYIPDSDTTTYPINYPTDRTGYHVATAGGYLYLTNEKNQSQDYELPSTGGTGTLPYTAVGGTMMLTALAYSMIHRKRRHEGRADD